MPCDYFRSVFKSVGSQPSGVGLTSHHNILCWFLLCIDSYGFRIHSSPHANLWRLPGRTLRSVRLGSFRHSSLYTRLLWPCCYIIHSATVSQKLTSYPLVDERCLISSSVNTKTHSGQRLMFWALIMGVSWGVRFNPRSPPKWQLYSQGSSYKKIREFNISGVISIEFGRILLQFKAFKTVKRSFLEDWTSKTTRRLTYPHTHCCKNLNLWGNATKFNTDSPKSDIFSG